MRTVKVPVFEYPTAFPAVAAYPYAPWYAYYAYPHYGYYYYPW